MVQTNISLPFITADSTGPKHLDMTLTRAKFNDMTADLIDKTKECMHIAMKDAGLTNADIDKGHSGRQLHPYPRSTGKLLRPLPARILSRA